MTRVKRGYVARKRRKRILQLNQGFRGAHSTLFRTANQQHIKALKYAYTSRARRKRDFRRLWISRINAAARKQGLNYNQVIHKLKDSKILINRKILAQLAIFDNENFHKLISYTNLKAT